MTKLSENSKKPILDPFGPFQDNPEILYKIHFSHFFPFSHLFPFPLSLSKISEKTYEYVLRIPGYRNIDGKTDKHEFIRP